MQNQERWKHLELLPLRQVEMIPEFRIVIGRGPGAAFPQIVSFQLRDQIGHLPAIDGIGGGMARGRVVGRTDAIGGDVMDTPVSPKDMQATAYHLLGYDESATVPDREGRPHPIAGSGRVRTELLG